MQSNPDSTIAYYQARAREYSAKTQKIDMGRIYNRFLSHIPPAGRILDAGSGSGRDTLAFLRQGYQVDAFDASSNLAALSTQLTGFRTQVLRFQDLDIPCRYDGIWACAALLHLKAEELPDAFARLQRSVKPNGIIYASFKEGAEERIAADGRFFTDLNKKRLSQIIKRVPPLNVIESWTTPGETGYHGQGDWLNVLLRNEG